jgi:hypothetical protein
MKQNGYSAITKACHWIIPDAAAKACVKLPSGAR